MLRINYPSSWRNISDSAEDEWSAWLGALIANPELSHSDRTPEDASGQAEQLLAAIDQGGVPTDPIRINKIARALGLNVLVSAPMEETIGRIRLLINKINPSP